MSEESRPIRAWDGIRCARCLTVKSRRSWWLSEGVCWMCGYTNPVPEQVEGESTPPARRDHEREAELTTTIEHLVWAMHLWGCDEDGIHPDAYATFQTAIDTARIPVTKTIEDGETRYRFDPDWSRRMRETIR